MAHRGRPDPRSRFRPVQSALVADDQIKEFEAFFEREKEGLFQALCLVTRNRFEAEELAQDASCPCTSAGIASRKWMSQPAISTEPTMNAFRSWHRRSSKPLTWGGACGTDQMVPWVSEGPENVAPGCVTYVSGPLSHVSPERRQRCPQNVLSPMSPGRTASSFPRSRVEPWGGGRWTLTELWEGGNRCA
jgi:hypothetical protein